MLNYNLLIVKLALLPNITVLDNLYIEIANWVVQKLERSGEKKINDKLNKLSQLNESFQMANVAEMELQQVKIEDSNYERNQWTYFQIVQRKYIYDI